MKRLKNSFLFLLIAAIFLLSSCQKAEEPLSAGVPMVVKKETASKDYITLLYSASDSLNPYQAKTDSNRQLCRLLFEPLVKTDNEFVAVYSLAKSVKTEGNTCTVILAPRTFSDGSALSAEDVVYSFGLAKKSETEYRYKLYEAVSATAKDASTVVFKLTKSDPYFENLLDFPILKKGSDTRTNSDGVALTPIGCGRYVADEEATKLICNVKTLGTTYPVKEIRLINAPDEESVAHYVEVNAADLYFNDISDGKIIRMSGNKADINLNHLVYLAVNRNVDALSVSELRQALSSGINREAICRECYFNNAIPATGFYNPVFAPVSAVQNIEIRNNQEITVANLETIGYNNTESGVRRNQNGIPLRFQLMVNEENTIRVSAANLIASQLGECGIRIEVKKVKSDAYRQALAEGNFQLCLTETAVTPNMDLSDLILEGGSAAFGLPKAKEKASENKEEQEELTPVLTAEELVKGVYTGANTIADAAQGLQNEMPFVPICYRTGVLFYNEQIEHVEHSSVSDMFFSIGSYSIITK